MKRKPLLVDEIIAGGLGYERFYTHKVIQNLTNQLRDAKRFVLDEDAVRHLGSIVKRVPEAIAYAQEFALRPFERMYIEFPFRVLWETVMEQPADKVNGDAILGYFYNGPKVYVFTKGYEIGAKMHRTRNIAMLPMRYHLNKPFTVKEEQSICGAMNITRIGLDAFFWGTAIDRIDDNAVRAFRANHSFEFFNQETAKFSTDVTEIAGFIGEWTRRTMVESSSGDLRNMIALLLLLNQPTGDVIVTDVAPVRQMLHNKAHTYVSHSIVKLNIDPVPRIKTMVKGMSGVWRKEHDVRGHFCHDDTWRNSYCKGHDPQEVGVNQWRCLKCGGLRWWRKEHRRGHKEKGRVKTSYHVTAA